MDQSWTVLLPGDAGAPVAARAAGQASALQPMIDTLATRAPLTAADRAAIAALPHAVRTIEAGACFVREAEAPPACAVLLSGFAVRQKLTSQGERQIVSVQVPGDPLDLQNLYLDVADHNVQMLTRATLATVARADLRRLADARPAIAHAFTVNILVEASIAREWLLNVGRRPAKARMAHLLCELAVRLAAAGLGEAAAFELPMTQEQLGDALGLTPVHVNRTLKALENDGLIARNHRQLRFPHPARIRRAADFNERYLHLAPQRAA